MSREATRWRSNRITELARRDGWRCRYCGWPLGDGPNCRPATIDEIRPRSKGGSREITNQVLACDPCNRAKGSRSVHSFLAELAAAAGRPAPRLPADAYAPDLPPAPRPPIASR